MAFDDVGSRIILNSGGTDSRLFMLGFDRSSGRVSLDSAFKSPGSLNPGFSMSNLSLSDGFHGTGLPHGAVFSR